MPSICPTSASTSTPPKRIGLRKKLLDIELNHVESVKVDYPGEDRSLSIARETFEAPFNSEDIAEDQAINDTEAEGLVRNLINARFSDIKETDDPDALAALEHSRVIELFLFNGENYSLRIGRKPAEVIEKEAEEASQTTGTEEDRGASDSVSNRIPGSPNPIQPRKMTNPK